MTIVLPATATPRSASAAMRPAPSVFSARIGAVGVANSSVLAAPEARTSGPCASAELGRRVLVRDGDVQVAVAFGAQLLDQGGKPAASTLRATYSLDAQRAEGGVVDGRRAALADVGPRTAARIIAWPFCSGPRLARRRAIRSRAGRRQNETYC